MGGSGIIYAVLVGLWAAYLIPMWLRHHDDTTEVRQADRFSHAMRTLSRRTAVPGTREVVLPRRPSQPLRPDGEAIERERAAAQSRARRAASRRRSLAVRRRRTLIALAALTLVAAVAAVAGLIDLVAPVGAFALTALYLVHLRVEAQRAVALARRSGGARGREQARQRWQEVKRVAERPDPRAARVRTPVAGRVAGEETGETAAPGIVPPFAYEPGVEAATAEAGEVARATFAPGSPASAPLADETFWEPVAVPLPTYVTAPKAVRPSRVIDLTRPGAWSEGQPLDRPLGPERAADADRPGSGLEQGGGAGSGEGQEPGDEGYRGSRWVVND